MYNIYYVQVHDCRQNAKQLAGLTTFVILCARSQQDTHTRPIYRRGRMQILAAHTYDGSGGGVPVRVRTYSGRVRRGVAVAGARTRILT